MPVDAPDGTAARKTPLWVVTSASTVGLPLGWCGGGGVSRHQTLARELTTLSFFTHSPGVDDLAADHLGDGGGRHLLERVGLWGCGRACVGGGALSRFGRSFADHSRASLAALGSPSRPSPSPSPPPPPPHLACVQRTRQCAWPGGRLGRSARPPCVFVWTRRCLFSSCAPIHTPTHQERQRLVRPGAHRLVDGGLDLCVGGGGEGAGVSVWGSGRERRHADRKESRDARWPAACRSGARPALPPPPLCRIAAWAG